MNVTRAGVVTGQLASRGIEQRLTTDRDDEDAQQSRHILGWGRSLAWLEDVVEEQKVHGEETDDQKNFDSASHCLNGRGVAPGLQFRPASGLSPENVLTLTS